jgi:hypothetical protein
VSERSAVTASGATIILTQDEKPQAVSRVSWNGTAETKAGLVGWVVYPRILSTDVDGFISKIVLASVHLCDYACASARDRRHTTHERRPAYPSCQGGCMAIVLITGTSTGIGLATRDSKNNDSD